MEKTPSQWIFSAGSPYCLQVLVTSRAEPARVQLYWCAVRKKECRLYLSAGRECQPLSDGDFTVFRLTETQWQAVVDGKVSMAPEQWEPLPFTLSELAVHPEFATFDFPGITETTVCGK
ncbi:hypothetical protein HZS38_00245 [Xenorhabdus nematophila]|uniref:hypothetical protein n=2 Tax=Xenorhabdus nematophila TaxID=628 RepID=UPI000543FFC6|nr:hypothetical protein [Xenorhabdus nematophila]CEF28661.1 conserved hypothetical protein [Xenorhabdus nematophila str. Websteri]AYA39144.1 hypothetical protein D3790_00350 [Xenorhabdus nematophila]AYA39213.1 hypothetical protein D3790_00805 [Xenorhabdus nematophila]KHD27108.1 hypothetical protein LH67_20875 [Xenorhabdus nematophila]MBA0017730.1 hypothetical protein [Xenorhabdus nematophila]